MKIGVIIARFQTPSLQKGQISLIEQIASRHKQQILILGVSPLNGSRENPYDYPTRKQMIKSRFPDVKVLSHRDHPSDAAWSEQLDQILINTFPSDDFALYGSEDRFVPHYSGAFESIGLKAHHSLHSGEIKDTHDQQAVESEAFRTGMLYALHRQYAKVYPTVDIAVFKANKKWLLLGQKPSSPQWRLPGGFTDPQDESYEIAAARELREEAGTFETTELTYETSLKIDDWRYREEPDKILTLLFSCDHLSGAVCAADDLANLDWFEVTRLHDMIRHEQIAPEHTPLLEVLIKKYLNDAT